MFKEGKKYIINLAHRFDRRKAMSEQCIKFDIKNAEYFNAVHHHVGWKGATISHMNVIRKAKELNLPYVIIMEDDCVLSEHLLEISSVLNIALPQNWDMFYWGANHLEGRPILHLGKIYKCTYATSAMCYAVRNNMYDKILDAVQLDKPHDVYYAEMHKSINAYCVLPNLAWQSDSYSDILEREVKYVKEFEPRWL